MTNANANAAQEFDGVVITLIEPENTVPDFDYSDGDATYPQSMVERVFQLMEISLNDSYPGCEIGRGKEWDKEVSWTGQGAADESMMDMIREHLSELFEKTLDMVEGQG